jgi:hypothetical protein
MTDVGLSERSRPCEIAPGVFVPAGPLTCPECGREASWHDSEGGVACPNDHRWWDSNSPEYVEMYRRLGGAESQSQAPLSAPVGAEAEHTPRGRSV